MPKLRSTCLRCGVEVMSWPSQPAKYCSRACYDAANVSTFDYAGWHARNRVDQNAKKTAWRLAHPEKRKGIQRAWRERNKASIAESSALRREIYKSGVTRGEIAAIMAAADGHCTYCGLPADKLELDHVEPVAAGGEHSVDNFLPACRTCNASKSASVAEDWLFERYGIEGLARAVVMLEQRARVVFA